MTLLFAGCSSTLLSQLGKAAAQGRPMSFEGPRAETADAADAARGLRETCHDMRQPVAGVLALAGAALSEPDLPRTVRVSLEQIVLQAERLADMIQDWLHGALHGDAGGD